MSGEREEAKWEADGEINRDSERREGKTNMNGEREAAERDKVGVRGDRER